MACSEAACSGRSRSWNSVVKTVNYKLGIVQSRLSSDTFYFACKFTKISPIDKERGEFLFHHLFQVIVIHRKLTKITIFIFFSLFFLPKTFPFSIFSLSLHSQSERNAKTYLLDNLTITTTRIEQQLLWSCPDSGAGFPYIVVVCGELWGVWRKSALLIYHQFKRKLWTL